MEWTLQERLDLIRALAAREYNNTPEGGKHRDLMVRIMFLCDMPTSFLEESKANYQDAVDIAKRGETVIL